MTRSLIAAPNARSSLPHERDVELPRSQDSPEGEPESDVLLGPAPR